MKTFKTVLIAFFAGLLGAAAYVHFLAPNADEAPLQEEPVLLSGYNASEVNNPQLPREPSVGDVSPDFRLAASSALPCVVFIKCISKGTESHTYWDYLFGGGRQQVQVSSGSGVIFTDDGYIVTNNHVIESAETIQVIYNKQSYEAELVGTDPSTDLAVLKIDKKNLPAITLGSSRDLGVGEWVIAVGNPFSLSSTVTAGIVSAKGRRLNIVRDKFPIESFIQTDAAINPGNSGGALVNKKGELVGINTAILSRTGSYTGYAFAVPVDIARKVVHDLIAYGLLQKAFLGGKVVDYDFESADEAQSGKEQYKGVKLVDVVRGGAAYEAGLREGDVVTSIDNVVVNSESAFEEEISYRSPGDKISVHYERDGKPRTAEIMLLNRNGDTELLRRRVFSDATLGASLEAVDYGVKVYKVRGGYFSRLGIPENFVITSINRQRVSDPEEIINFFESYKGRCILRGVNRSGREMSMQFYIR